MRYSRRIIENTVRYWGKRLLMEANPNYVYDELFERMMDLAAEDDRLPNWMRTPEFVAELRNFAEHRRGAAPGQITQKYFEAALRQFMTDRWVFTFTDFGKRQNYNLKYSFPDNYRDWPTMREFAYGRVPYGDGAAAIPLFNSRFVFFVRLDRRSAAAWRDEIKYRKDDILFGMPDPDSADAASVCLAGTDVLAIDGNGVVG